MEIAVKEMSSWMIIAPEGAIDFTGGLALKSKILDSLDHGHFKLLINLASVTSMDSAGLGSLVSVGHKVLTSKGGRLAFCHVSPGILKIFNTTHLSRLFPVYNDERTALAALTAQAERYKVFAFLGANEAVFQQLSSLAVGRASIELLQGTFEDLKTALKGKNYAALLIEEQTLSPELNKIISTKYNGIPLLLLVPAPCTASKQKQIRENLHIDHIVEYPFAESEARVLLNELIESQGYGSDSRAIPPGEQLFRQYTATLPDKLENIELLFTKLCQDPQSIQIEELEKAIHKISGSAGSYGYVKAGEICKELELLLAGILQKGKSEPKDLENISHLLTKIKFYFNVTLYKDLSQKNLAIKPVVQRSVFLISADDGMIHFFKRVAEENLFKIDMEKDPQQAINHLKQLETKPQIVICENSLPNSSTNGVNLIKSIKSILSSDQMKFVLLVDEDSLDINAQAIAEGIHFIIKKPPSAQQIENLFQGFGIDRATQPYKILVVDDDVDVGNFIANAMQNYAVELKISNDETAILDDLYAFSPHLLLLDINLPKYDGWSLLKILRTDLRYRDLKVIIITASKDWQSSKLTNQQFDDIWPKPLDKFQLQQKILQLSEGHFSQSFKEHEFATFSNPKEFNKLLKAVVGGSKGIYYLVLIGSAEYKSIIDSGKGVENEYLAAAEMILNREIKGDCLRGYLGRGFFAFLFPDMPAGQLETLLGTCCTGMDYKIILPSKSGDLFISFIAHGIAFHAEKTDVKDLLTQSMNAFDSLAKANHSRVLIAQA